MKVKYFFYPPQEEYSYRRHRQLQRRFRDRLNSSRWKNENDKINFPYDFSGEKQTRFQKELIFFIRQFR